MTLRQKYNEALAQIQQLTAQLNTAQSSLEACQADLSAKVSEIETLKARIAELEAQLPKPPPTPEPTGHVLLGAWAEFDGDGQSTLAEQERFDTLSQAKMEASMIYAPWKNADGSAVKFSFATAIYNAGRFPHVPWGAQGAPPIPEVAAGQHDAFLVQTAKNIATISGGKRFQWRPWWEMNGRWMAHCADKYGNDPSVFREAWQRLAAAVRQYAPKCELVWAPAHASLPNEAWNAMKNYYPGDTYVDIVGGSVYNKYGVTGGSQTWRSFEQLVQELTAVTANKPLMMTEGACLEDPAQPGRKAQWITEMGAYAKTHPRWEGLLWFHRGEVSREPINFYVDTTPASLAAWRKLCQDPYFKRPA